MNELSKRLADLSPEKQALLVQALQNSGALNAFPLSFAQQRLWFLDQLVPGSPAYNLSSMLRLTGPLDRDALEAALQGIVGRHEVLRTTFIVVGGQPIQVAQPRLAVGLTTVDLRQVPAHAQDDAIQTLAHQEARRPFHLAAGPLLRATLLRLAPERHALLLTAHHTVADGWSLAVFWRELAELYAAARQGRPPQLPELTTQYADYAVWQRQWLQGQRLDALMSYWRAQLDGAPALLLLPTDHARRPQYLDDGAQHALRVPQGLAAALGALSRHAGATLFMTLLAAFQVLLARYSGQDDIVVTTPVAGRTGTETEGLIGCFVNTLALRTDLAGDPTFRELLQRVRGVCLDAYAHQELPFELLIEALRPERDLSYAPLAQVMLAFQNTPPPTLELDGLTLHPTDIDTGTAKFDLTLNLSQGADGLDGYLEYRTDLFDAATIARMAGHFLTLLEGIAAHPNLRVSALPLLTAAEQRRQLVDWNVTEADYPTDQRLHTLVEAQAARTPDAIAIAGADEQLTYAQLNRRANQLAHHLRRLGIGPDTRVGIHMQRSPSLVVALLATLKAGGAYLPLDPDYPHERLAWMLDDAQVAVLITLTSIYDLRFTIYDLPVSPSIVNLDADWPTIAQQPQTNLESGVAGENLAYIIYTSGSSGRPKGVMVPHRAVVNHLCWMQATFPLSASDRIVQNTSLSFDVSVWELFAPLAWGAQLVLPAPDERQDSIALIRTIHERQVTFLQLVPALLAVLLDTPGFSGCRSLRQVLCGGEALPFELQERFFAALQARLHHMYGPTETAIDACFWSCEPAGERRPVPIGRPVGNAHAYILDAHMLPAPIGTPGELYIGGAGLARGYLNRPELTAERFVPNPFLKIEDRGLKIEDSSLAAHHKLSSIFYPLSSTRLYRTGDLCRHREDGAIEFLGRLDQQIKLRGFRIELGEIEAVLRRSPAVRECVVVAREDVPGEKRLVAYVVPTTEDRGLKIEDSHVGADAMLSSILYPLSSELRQFLRAHLPDHMIPAAFVLLDALPLTPNGKLDRNALPAATDDRPSGAAPLVAPRSPVEELLLGIWEQLLGREQISVHDNFFELGGHSLLATQVIARVRQLLALELPLRSLFEAPTIAELALRVAAAQRADAPSHALPLVPLAQPAELPLSFAQQRLWFLHQLDPLSSAYNLAITLRVSGALNLAALRHSLDGVIARHQALRTSFPTVEGRPVQLIAPPSPLGLPLVDLQGLPASQRDAALQQLVREETQRPFDLARGPLARACLFRLDRADAILTLTLHHIVSDGWSLAILIRETAALYTAFCTEQVASLAPLPIQYADYAHWQQRRLQDAELEAQMGYWRRQLAGMAAMLELPTDHPRPPVQSFRGATQSLLIPAQLATALVSLSRREGVTLFMTLLAALQVLLYRYSGQKDIVVGSPIANRTRSEVEGLIGFFVNTLVLRTDLGGNPSFQALLARVREVCLGAYAHQDVPFEKLVEELQPERSLSYSPLFQVMLALQNAPLPSLELPGLTLEWFEVEQETAKFDLLLSIDEAGGGLKATLEYNTDLFEPATIERLLAHWQTLLAGIIAEPAGRLSDLPLLTEAEREQMLVGWNATEATYPGPSTLHQLFEAQAARTPDAVALVWDEQRISYQALNRRANQLARLLRRQGVGAEMLVGVCLNRSLEMVIAVLGVLKAGAAYLPLDPNYPHERLAFMLEDAQVAVLLTTRRAEGEKRRGGEEQKLPMSPPLSPSPTLPLSPSVVDLTTDWERIAEEPFENLVSGAAGENLAYLIYTSGSTGRPKGVAIAHQSAVNLVRWAGERFSAEQLAGVLASTSLCFDLSVFELFVPLCRGGKVIVAENAVALPTLPAAAEVTLLNTVPSALAELVRMGGLPPGVSTVTLAGEPLPRRLVEQLYRQPGIAQVCNLYAPSETTTYSTYALVPSGDERAPSIGRPLANTQIYVLDQWMQPLPVGVAGELYIGGAGVARGYLGRPELTAERFVPSPFSERRRGGEWESGRGADSTNSLSPPLLFSPSPLLVVGGRWSVVGGRLYKTGDLARYRPDGNIEFLGRKDHQVKLRGFRIELGEIEAVLRQSPAVHKCVVVAREDVPGERLLVAYVVPTTEDRGLKIEDSSLVAQEKLSSILYPLSSELRRFLRDRLPDYMIPSAFVLLDALPRTPNGKVDRAALPADTQGLAAPEPEFAARRTPAEELLAAIWADVLGRESIGAHDHFFDMGGHSLLATRVISQMRETFQVDLPLRELFEAPTVAALAQRIAALRGSAGERLPLRPAQRSGPVPLSFAQQRLWLLDRFDPGSASYTIASALRLAGPLDVAALQDSVNAVVERHEALRTTFTLQGEQPLQVIAPALTIPLPLVDLWGEPAAAQERRVRELAQAEARRPFDLERGPLLRTTLLRRADDDHVLLVMMHHIVADGWSIAVLIREVAAYYPAYRGRGEDTSPLPPLPPLPVQFADYALWQRQWLQGEALERQRAYWKERLSGYLPTIELPVALPRPATLSFQGAQHVLAIGEPLTAALAGLSRREHVTMFMTLLAAFAALLSRYTGEEDIVVGTPIANRTQPEIEPLIGFFVNMLALRIDLAGNPSFRGLLRRVRETCLEAYAHQEMPFDQVVEAVQPWQNASRMPLFNVVLVLQNVTLPPLELPDLAIELLEVETNTAKYDLTLTLTETPAGLRGALEYRTDLFDAMTIARLLEHFQTLLAAAAAAPDRPILALPLVNEAELRLLDEWSGSRR